MANIFSGVLNKLFSLATEEMIRFWKIDKDLHTLQYRFKHVGNLLEDAHTKKLTSTAQMWFDELEAVAHVANALMEELEYEVTRRKVKNTTDFFIDTNRVQVVYKIKSIQDSVTEIFDLGKDLGLLPLIYLVSSSTVQTRDVRSTPYFEDKSLIVGRDKDVSHLVLTVCEDHEQDLRVVALAGMGGQGKTTLARMIFNNNDVIKMFPKRMWVTVSDDFDFIQILNQMVESLISTNLRLTNSQGLTNELQKRLEGEKFILVLDDVWNEEAVKWDNLKNSLLQIGGPKGSCILVTCRKQEVIDVMRGCFTYQVEKLSEEESYVLFRNIAFSDGGVLETKAFAALGRSMVEKCRGLPLAIKALGGLLYSKKSEQEWLEIQNSETWQSEDVLPSLKLSYDNLPYLSLKRCFAYCSIMPKDSVIHKDELIQMWMGLGFLLPPRTSSALMEDIGNKYFNILLWNFLLQDVERDELGNISSCKMHDMVHDLALELSKHHSVTLKAGKELNHDCRPAYVRVDQGVSDIKPTIVKINYERVQMLHAGANILRDLLTHLKHLTVLVLNTDEEVAKELPRSMKYLKHLDISCSSSRLPTYITKLYNLQTLRVGVLDELPNKFCNLINLRHMYITKESGRRCTFNEIERLTNLQTLPHFVVSRVQNCLIGQLGGLKNLRGDLKLYGLNEVENIEEASKAKLHEKSNIQHILLKWRKNEDESKDKKYNDEEVMEGLEAHRNLKGLTVEDFRGQNLALWITMMTNLVKITLKDCNMCEVLMPLGHLPKLRNIDFNGMKNVKVIGNDLCRGLSGAPEAVATTLYPSLTKIRLWNMPKLEEWVETVMDTGGNGQSVFPKLESLDIKNCLRLRKIPRSCFLSLKDLIIGNLESSMLVESMSRNVSSLTTLKLGGGNSSSSFFSSSSRSDMESIINVLLKNISVCMSTLELIECKGVKRLTVGVSVERLWVYDCPDLMSIRLNKGPARLKSLTIRKCSFSLLDMISAQIQSSALERLKLGPFLEKLDEFPWPFSYSAISLHNLIRLELFGWENVKSIALLEQLQLSPFPELKELIINDFKGVEALPGSIPKLPSLQKLKISDCNNMKSLPKFEKLHSLQRLDIVRCPILKERCRKDGGPEWSKIQHVPRITWG